MARPLRKQMWMTNRRFGRWVPAPQFNADVTREGASDEIRFRNGGTLIDASTVGSKVYNLTWNPTDRENLQPITDFATGVHGLDPRSRKPLPVWIVNPMEADRNVFSPGWATPALGFSDALPLIVEREPRLVPTPPNPYHYPIDQASYRTDGDSEVFFIPLPENQVIWLGAHGKAGPNTGIQVAGVTRNGVLEPEMLPMMGYTDELVSTPFADPSWLGVEVSVRSTGFRQNLFADPGFGGSYGNEGKYDYVLTGPNGQANAYIFGEGYGGSKRSANYTQEISATGPGNGIYADIAVTAGEFYSFGVQAWTSQLTRLAASVRWFNASNGFIGQTAPGASVRAEPSVRPWDEPYRLSVEGVRAPEGAVRARVLFTTVIGDGFSPSIGLIDNPDEWHQMGFSSLMANRGSKLLPYRDGDSDGWHWAGVPNGSISQEEVSDITLGALVAQVLPSGRIPKRGRFPSGQGSGGLSFRGFPAESHYSAALDLIGMSATLVETQPWV